MSMSPKQALIKDGTVPVKEGRGRLSREADERCRQLVSEGWDIRGYAVNTTKSVDKKVNAEKRTDVVPAVNKVVVTNEKIVQEFTILYDERMYVAVDATGQPWSMRNACNNCRVSLVQCHCGNPSIFGDIGVKIVAK